MRDIYNNSCSVIGGKLKYINPDIKELTVPTGVDAIDIQFLPRGKNLALETLTLPIVAQHSVLTIYGNTNIGTLASAMKNLRKIIVPSRLKRIDLPSSPVFGESLNDVVINGTDCDIGTLILNNVGIKNVTFPIGYKYIDKLPKAADLKTINMVIDKDTDFANLKYPYNDGYQDNFWLILSISQEDREHIHWNNLKNAEEVNIVFDSENSFIECIMNGNFLKLSAYLKLLARKSDGCNVQYADVKYRFVCKDNSNNEIIGLLNDIYKNVGYSISVFESIIRHLFGCCCLNIELLKNKLEKVKSRTSQVHNFGLAVKCVLSSLDGQCDEYIPLDGAELGEFRIFLSELHDRILSWFDFVYSRNFVQKIRNICLETFKKLLDSDESIESIIKNFSTSLLNISNEVLEQKKLIYENIIAEQLSSLSMFRKIRKQDEEQ